MNPVRHPDYARKIFDANVGLKNTMLEIQQKMSNGVNKLFFEQKSYLSILFFVLVGLLFSFLVFAQENTPTTPVLAVSPATLSFSGVVGGTNPLSQDISISNAGTGTLLWSVSDNADWLALTPVSGQNNATVSTAVSLAGLVANTYNAVITVSATGDATGTPKTINATLVISPASVSPPPPAPETLRKVKQSMEINPNGMVQLRNAKVESLGSTSVVVKVWGHIFTVEVTSETKLRGHGEGKIEMADVKVGDLVDVKGIMNEDTGVITARELNDNSAKSKKDAEREGKIAEIRKLIEGLKKQLEGLIGKNREKNNNKHDNDD